MPTPFLPSTPLRDAPPGRALLGPWYAEQQARVSSPFQVLALQFQVDPIGAPTTGDVFLNVWPGEDGEGRWTHNTHPDRTAMQTRAGDILVNRGERFRVRAVKIYRSSRVQDERAVPWFQSVGDGIWDASR